MMSGLEARADAPAVAGAGLMLIAGLAGIAIAQILAGLAGDATGPLQLAKILAHACTLLGVSLLLARPSDERFAWLVACGWLILFLLAAAEALPSGSEPAAWVGTAQAAALAASGAALATVRDRSKGPPVLRLLTAVTGAMLILFGAVHILEAQAIAAMIPSWFPLREDVPVATGSLQVLAGLAIAIERARLPAALLIAAMFLSWLPLVHAPRIAADPASLFEWSFASMALALSGCLCLVAALGHAGAEATGQPRDRDAPAAAGG